MGNANFRSTLEAIRMSSRRISKAKYYILVISDADEPDAAVNGNFIKAKRALIQIRPLLRSKNLTTSI